VILLKENVQQYLQYQHQCAADTMLFSQGIKQHRNQQLHCSRETAGCSPECMILKNIKQLPKKKNSSWKSNDPKQWNFNVINEKVLELALNINLAFSLTNMQYK
jgi:hypothetical protein